MGDNIDDATFPPPAMVAEPRGYALSGKIMLSAIVILFAVVIIMVCLHIYARWYLLRARRRQIRRARRRTHLVFYLEPNNPGNIFPVPTQGLDAAVLKSLPTFKYKASGGGGDGDGDGDGEEMVECAVCLSEFEEGERGRLLPKCNHSFHVDCIDMWFHSHSTCPICRAPVDGDDFPAKSAEDPAVQNVIVELAELTQSQPARVLESGDLPGPSQPGPSSGGGRRKGLDLVGVSIEVPRRTQSFSFTNSDESGPSRSPRHGFRSPTSRILSLKRILSREKKSPLPSPTAAGTSVCSGGDSAAELDVELGLVEAGSQPSRAQTPR